MTVFTFAVMKYVGKSVVMWQRAINLFHHVYVLIFSI